MVLVRVLAALLAGSILATAHAAPVSGTAAPAVPAAKIASAVDDARTALRAKPVACDAVERAFAGLARGGRATDDVDVLLEARRSDLPCVVQSADRAIVALGIQQAEIVTWLLAHPPPPELSSLDLSVAPADATAMTPAPLVVERALDCGLVFASQRIDRLVDDARLLLMFRNETGRTVVAHDLRVGVNGPPRPASTGIATDPTKSYVESGDRPIGEVAAWDNEAGKWGDKREIESRELRVTIGAAGHRLKAELKEPALPGGTFEAAIALDQLWSPELRADRYDVTFEECTLTLQ